MQRSLHTLAVIAAVALLYACGGDHDHDHDHDHTDQGHTDGGDDSHGQAHVLGTQPIGGYTVKVTVHGEIKAGEEGHITVNLYGADAAPMAVRVWAGVESAEGSARKKFDLTKEDDGWHKHDHIEAPAPLPADSRLWVEVETAAGVEAGAFDLK